MNLRKNILTSLLIAMGYIMHQVTPGTIGNMKFDIMLAFIFTALFINRDLKGTILTGLLGGAITALTTTFPGGQLPNIIDKLVTCLVIYTMLKVPVAAKYTQVKLGVVAFLGTVVSGSTFLYSALIMVGLPAPFGVLFFGIVLPTALTNIFVTLLVFNAVKVAAKASGAKYIQI